MQNFYAAEFGRARGASGQGDGFEDGDAARIHEDGTGPGYITHDVDDIGLAHDDRVAGEDSDIALRIVAQIARDGQRDGMVGIAAMSDGNAVAGFFGQAAGSRKEIVKMLFSEHGINAGLGHFSEDARALRGVLVDEQSHVGIFDKGGETLLDQLRCFFNSEASNVSGPDERAIHIAGAGDTCLGSEFGDVVDGEFDQVADPELEGWITLVTWLSRV